jgi:AcrR family transcriptional regulator
VAACGRAPSRTGLRERKKLETRQNLGSAALRLALERGLENITAEDIAAAVGVAPRTFWNYFSSKQDAICAPALDRARLIGASLRVRPAGEPLWEALSQAVLEHYRETDQPLAAQQLTAIRLLTGSPAISGEYLKVTAAAQCALAEAIADRTGADAEQDMQPMILAGAITAAAQAALLRWSLATPPVPLGPLLRLALQQLAAAFQVPRPAAGQPPAHAPGDQPGCPVNNSSL